MCNYGVSQSLATFQIWACRLNPWVGNTGALLAPVTCEQPFSLLLAKVAYLMKRRELFKNVNVNNEALVFVWGKNRLSNLADKKCSRFKL